MTILDVEGVTNVRDVGGIPAEGGRIRPGVLLRSGQLSTATTNGAAFVVVGGAIGSRSWRRVRSSTRGAAENMR